MLFFDNCRRYFQLNNLTLIPQICRSIFLEEIGKQMKVLQSVLMYQEVKEFSKILQFRKCSVFCDSQPPDCLVKKCFQTGMFLQLY